jgi:catechol 2,3-dioxygenase-like lactoylglutathione lyase family enzyme
MISRIILFVADVDSMTRFYRDAIGLAVVDDSDPGFVVLGGGGCDLALHRIPVEIVGEGSPERPRENSYVKIAFQSDDVAADRVRLIGRGTLMRELHRYGTVEFCDGIDPEGNVFQISSR